MSETQRILRGGRCRQSVVRKSRESEVSGQVGNATEEVFV